MACNIEQTCTQVCCVCEGRHSELHTHELRRDMVGSVYRYTEEFEDVTSACRGY